MESGEGPASLTGVWHGLYTYDWGEQEGFIATLIQVGRAISGSTHEQDTHGWASGAVLYASVEGSVEGGSVVFRKTYDGTAGWTHSVIYNGMLGPDRNEIEGVWTIPGEDSGRFLMIRNSAPAEAARREAVERA